MRRAQRATCVALAVCLAAAFATPVLADEPSSRDASERPVATFGEDNPSCREWSDGCIVCAKRKDESPACSTRGIACVPGSVACIAPGD